MNLPVYLQRSVAGSIFLPWLLWVDSIDLCFCCLQKKKQQKKKTQLKFSVDCTHPVEDGIMDVANFVSNGITVVLLWNQHTGKWLLKFEREVIWFLFFHHFVDQYER